MSAMKDAEKCLAFDPNQVKAWARKASIHHLMKEYHKALECYDKGLTIEPDSQDLIQGKQKTMMAISTGAYSGGDDENNEERVRHAMADPEIQLLLQDPRV